MATEEDSLDAAVGRLKGGRTASLLAPVVGAAAGLAFYYVIGCRTGACLLTSQWWSSMAYGALMGALVRAAWPR